MQPPRAKGPFSLGVVILGAGASTRMGKPKLLLPWGKTSILGHLIQQWRALRAAQIAVIGASGDRRLEAELVGLGFPVEGRILNPHPERGMFSSVQCAAQWPGWQAALTHWAIVLGDQPHLRRETLRKVLDFSAAHPASVCQPARHGHGRHPVLLPRSVFRQLADATAATFKDFLAAAPAEVARCALDDPGLDLDIDRPGDYEQALKIAGLTR